LASLDKLLKFRRVVTTQSNLWNIFFSLSFLSLFSLGRTQTFVCVSVYLFSVFRIVNATYTEASLTPGIDKLYSKTVDKVYKKFARLFSLVSPTNMHDGPRLLLIFFSHRSYFTESIWLWVWVLIFVVYLLIFWQEIWIWKVLSFSHLKLKEYLQWSLYSMNVKEARLIILYSLFCCAFQFKCQPLNLGNTSI
jgi:hypothetical protein